jgi:hypothetical protein
MRDDDQRVVRTLLKLQSSRCKALRVPLAEYAHNVVSVMTVKDLLKLRKVSATPCLQAIAGAGSQLAPHAQQDRRWTASRFIENSAKDAASSFDRLGQ